MLPKSLKKTTIYESQRQYGAKFTPFGEWLMPLSYSSVLKEVKAVREQVGLFDVSHMGDIWVKGPKALEFLNYAATNDVSRLSDKQGQYSAFLNQDGGVMDDTILYRFNSEKFFVCANAGNSDKIFAHLCKLAKEFAPEHSETADSLVSETLKLENKSSDTSQIAVQGPGSLELLENLFASKQVQSEDPIASLNYTFLTTFTWQDSECFITRTGYTGEKGYEIYIPSEIAAEIWDALLDTEPTPTPIGLGARDILRLEACYLLWGSDMDETITPYEAGIGWAVRLKKGDFYGRAALVEKKTVGLTRKLSGFKLLDSGIPRPGMEVYAGETLIGTVTSGSKLPSPNLSGGLAMLDTKLLEEDTELFIDIRGQRKRAVLHAQPFIEYHTKD